MFKKSLLLLCVFNFALACSGVQEKSEANEMETTTEGQSLNEQQENWVVAFDIKKGGKTVSNPKAGMVNGNQVQMDLETYDESGEVACSFSINLLPQIDDDTVQVSGQIEGYLDKQLESTIEIKDSLTQNQPIDREITVGTNTYLIRISISKA